MPFQWFPLVSSRNFRLYVLITFFVGVQNHPRRDEMGQIKYDPVSSKLNSIPASMLTDKYSFIGCLQVLEQIFENSKPNNTESTKQSSGSSATSSNGVTPPPGVAPPGVNPPPGVGSSAGSANGSPVGSPPGSQRSNRTQFPTLDKDMTKMGISFIKDNRLIYRFQSPFADMPCRVQDIDMFVPGEYLTNIHIREKLAEIKVNTGRYPGIFKVSILRPVSMSTISGPVIFIGPFCRTYCHICDEVRISNSNLFSLQNITKIYYFGCFIQTQTITCN